MGRGTGRAAERARTRDVTGPMPMGRRSLLRHSSLSQAGEIGGFKQRLDLRHPPISAHGPQTSDARIAIVGTQPAGLGRIRALCCVTIGNVVFVGTDDAHILRVDPGGAQQCLTGFDALEGRDRWYAGSIDHRRQADGAAAWNSFNGGDM